METREWAVSRSPLEAMALTRSSSLCTQGFQNSMKTASMLVFMAQEILDYYWTRQLHVLRPGGRSVNMSVTNGPILCEGGEYVGDEVVTDLSRT